MTTPRKLASIIQLVAFDIDGVMTDGSLVYSADGSELKIFNSLDGHGVKMLRMAGIRTAIITGRTSKALEHRAENLGIDFLYQSREDKLEAIKELMQEANITPSQVAYIGDDLPDLSAIQYVGFGGSVVNADPFVKQHANWISSKVGGHGAVREFCEFILDAQGQLDNIHNQYLLKK